MTDTPANDGTRDATPVARPSSPASTHPTRDSAAPDTTLSHDASLSLDIDKALSESATFWITWPGTAVLSSATTASCGTARGSPAPSPAVSHDSGRRGVNTMSYART